MMDQQFRSLRFRSLRYFAKKQSSRISASSTIGRSMYLRCFFFLTEFSNFDYTKMYKTYYRHYRNLYRLNYFENFHFQRYCNFRGQATSRIILYAFFPFFSSYKVNLKLSLACHLIQFIHTTCATLLSSFYLIIILLW